MMGKKDNQGRNQLEVVSLEGLVPKNHLVRKIERVFADAKEKHGMRNLYFCV